MTKQRKPRPRRPGKPSTALVVRRRSRLPALLRRALAAPALIEHSNTLGEEATLGALGLVEIQLTPREEAILSRPVDVAVVQMKPTGQPYLSHPAFTRWLNEAFGRLGWGIVPRAKPMKSDKSVVCPYVLYIHGQPAAFAMGEQEYFESNREQTYGDALEATVASALRRCAKRLGVGLELWDRRWLDHFIATSCVKVRCVVTRDGTSQVKYFWRRRDDPPFWNEQGDKSGEPTPGPVERATNDGSIGTGPFHGGVAWHDHKMNEPITKGTKQHPGQVERFWSIARAAGRSKEEIRAWLAVAYNIDSTLKILRKDYQAICAALECPGPLQMPTREPGEENDANM